MAWRSQPLPGAQQQRARVVLGTAFVPRLEQAYLALVRFLEGSPNEPLLGSEMVQQRSRADAQRRCERPQR